MRHAIISSVNQIAHASQFVDPEVESEIRTFHQHCISVAGSPLESALSQPYLTVEDLKRAEAFETRFSHITGTISLGKNIPESIWRLPSLEKGGTRSVDFQTILFAKSSHKLLALTRPDGDLIPRAAPSTVLKQSLSWGTSQDETQTLMFCITCR